MSTNNLCSMSTHRAPFCPSCGQLASHWSEYREETSTPPISTNVQVGLSWVCDACHFDVTVKARVATADVVGVA